MTKLLIFLISLYQLYSFTNSELVNSPRLIFDSSENIESPMNRGANIATVAQLNGNRLENGDTSFKSFDDETEIDFEEPISSINIDYARNAIILQFRKQRQKGLMETDSKSRSLNKNFMRFGRSNENLMRFGKRQLGMLYNNQPEIIGDVRKDRNERSDIPGSRESRGDNFMRFGRSGADFMQLGKSGSNSLMRFGRANDFMRFGRQPTANPNFMRFGRGNSKIQSFHSDAGFKQLDHGDSNTLRRSGRPDSFMRFGRSEKHFGKEDEIVNRYGKHDDVAILYDDTKNDKNKSSTSISDSNINNYDAMNYILTNELYDHDRNHENINNVQDSMQAN